jgi:hypothetical protein
MTSPKMNRIAIGATIVVAGCGAVFFVAHQSPHPISSALAPPAFEATDVPPIAHTVAWYMAHPDILKRDEQRCAGDAATISQAACQNVASADAQVAAGDFAKAAVQNAAANAKTPNAP